MNQDLKEILGIIEQVENLGEEELNSVSRAIKAVDKELAILNFKLDRTEKVKRTTEVLLEETIQELEKKRADVVEANAALHKSLEELKAAQTQLIHAEKMASLGSLTAGIAHEIQNPLNFINNFSELNAELIEDLLEELESGDMDEIKALIDDLTINEGKISQHGKRADAIVKNMLQHSRSSSGTKIPTDINTLVNEYLRLAYHGVRAKDNSFSVDIKTELDETLPKIDIIPQNIGRVLLNLMNNAFYAVSVKMKQDHDKYVPMVLVRSKSVDGKIEIMVEDNGNGMPDDVLKKVFQPFFTTKPTGQGTGLGLSLSYDIVTKGHGGELLAETIEGTGSKFFIFLPV